MSQTLVARKEITAAENTEKKKWWYFGR